MLQMKDATDIMLTISSKSNHSSQTVGSKYQTEPLLHGFCDLDLR